MFRQFNFIKGIIFMLNNGSRLLLPAIASVLALALCGFMQDEWVFVSPDKKFSIEFPATLMTPEEGVEMGDEEGLRMMLWATQRTASGNFILMYSDLSELAGSDKEEVREEAFQNMIRGFLSSQSADYTLLSERKVKSGKFSGKEFKAMGVIADDSSRFFTNGQIFIAGKRIYVIAALHRLTEPDSAASTRFFNSFKILKP